MNQAKNVARLQAGDVISFYGGRFLVIEDSRELQSYRPESAHLTIAPGPCNGAIARSVCVEGSVPGYFKPGTEWVFQGTYAGTFAVNYAVESYIEAGAFA